jgi:glucosylceramidase
MNTRQSLRAAATAALAALAGCSQQTRAPEGVVPRRERVYPTELQEIRPIQVWLTTGDQAKLLAREPNIALTYNVHFAVRLPVIAVDPDKPYQQVVGFGAAMTDASAYLINRLAASDRETLLQDLFGRDNGIGLSFMRVPMGASDFSMRHYSYDDVPVGQTDSTLDHFSIDPDRVDKLPLIRRALAINPQLKVMASPWSVPGWMKSTNSLIAGTLLPRFYDSFADYFVKFIHAYEAEGVPVYAISLQNEPNYEPANYPGMRLDPAARARVIGNHLGPRFARAGVHTLIWDWDHNWDLPQQPIDVLADTNARKYVQGVAWHCYRGDVSAQSTVHDAHPDKDAYFSECSGGEWSPKFADDLKWFVQTLIIGATRNWARGVLLWNLALDENYGPHLGGCGNCRGVVTINSVTGKYTRNVEYYALAHASKFVHPGAHRLASSSDSTLASVAFRNEDGTKVVIVLNPGKAETMFGLRWGPASVSSSEAGSFPRNEAFAYTLPAGSVATFVWK